MKKTIIAIASLLISNTALADGFICDSAEGNLRLKVFHKTHPEMGTRNSAILVVSNPSIGEGRKTIATFEADDAVLGNEASTYTANVDLRFRNSNRKGELVGPTKLGELKHIVLAVDFSYANPVPAGTELSGEVTLLKRSGEQEAVDVVCARYLKGE